MRYFLRTKLIISFFLVVLLIGIAAILISVLLVGNWSARQANETVLSNLAAAHTLYTNKLEEIQTVLEFTALRPRTIRDALIAKDRETLYAKLEEVRNLSALDMLAITNETGEVFVRAHNPDVFGDSVRDEELVARIFDTNEPVNGTFRVEQEQLLREGTDLANRAVVELNTTDDKQDIQSSGLIIGASSPVRNENGALIGVLYGGNLLNRNNGIVDQARESIFNNELYKGRELGTATLFLGNICIASTVRSSEVINLIGTQSSYDIFNDNMKEGAEKINRVLVGTDWYLTAYEPIRGINGSYIGMFSIGILEQKFVDIRNSRLLLTLGVILSGIMIALLISVILSGNVLKPLRDLALQSQKQAATSSDFQYGFDAGDDVDRLGKAFNFMALAIKERDIEIQEKCIQINEAKRLSTLGQLAAGVAHEINNPLGGILVYASLLHEDTSPDDPRYSNIEKIIRESNRCKKIVKSLLNFARQSHPNLNEADVNRIITEALNNIRNETLFEHIRIIENYGQALPAVQLDASQIQEVFENIIRNAAEIMDGSGEFAISSRISNSSEKGGSLEILFSDTGPGVDPEYIDHIFDPFFTTKTKGHGTGLGLSVSYGIVERHGGTITVTNRPGGGAIFTVRLPIGG